MPLFFTGEPLEAVACDAIIAPDNAFLTGSSALSRRLNELAGESGAHEKVDYGQAVLTPGGSLPCRYLIRAVPPRWYHGLAHEEDLLAASYTSALKTAKENGCERVALAMLSPGAFYGFSPEKEYAIALKAMRPFFEDGSMTVLFAADKTVFEEADRQELEALLAPPPMFLDAICEESTRELKSARRLRPEPLAKCAACESAAMPSDLTEELKSLDKGFSETLLHLIDEKGMTDTACYKRANVDRKLFSKIRSNPAYRPSKQTALAFAVALELSLTETDELLKRAGFALSPSSPFDCIVSYYIRKRTYDVLKINEALFAFDQPLLG